MQVKGTYFQNDKENPLVYGDINLINPKRRRLRGEEEKEGIVHHLIDIKDVSEDYTVYDYQKDVRKLIEDINSRGKRIIIVGGTGLYIKSALYDYTLSEEKTNDIYDELNDEEFLSRIKNTSVFLRGTIYTICIFLGEYFSGRLLTRFHVCPWNYEKAKLNIHKVIRLDYAPLWFLFGLFLEKILNKHSKTT